MRYVTYEAEYLAKDWTKEKINVIFHVDIRWWKASEDFIADLLFKCLKRRMKKDFNKKCMYSSLPSGLDNVMQVNTSTYELFQKYDALNGICCYRFAVENLRF